MVLICPTFVHNNTLGGLCGSPFPNFCHCLRARRGETLACKKSTKPSDFFPGTNTIIVVDDCATLKELKSSTGQRVSLGFSACHEGITSISKPFCENMAAIALFYSPSDKTAKAIQDYAGELTSEKNENLMAELKKQNFLIWSLPCAIPTESKLLVNIFGMSE